MKKILLLMPILIVFACQEQPATAVNHDIKLAKPTFEITPPVEEFTPHKEVFSIDNTKDTVLISEHGSFVHVPSHCFVNEEGQPATNVEVEFTEYTNPADILFSGIPMEFVTANGNETFQSAGMCEIDASSAGKNVSIAEGKGIDIGLKNRAQDPDYNLYYFDREKGEWVEREKDLPVDTDCIPVKPVTVATIDTSRIVHVDVADYSLNKEFRMWDKTKFYLLPGQEPKYHDSAVYWYNMEVVETTNPELFILKFNGTHGVEQVIEVLKVQPLVTPENHDEAMRLFNRKMRAHAKQLLGRKAERSTLMDVDETVAQLEQEHIAYKKAKEEERIADSIRWEERYAADQARAEVMRTFEVNQLGLYNCDRFYKREILATKKISFTHHNEIVEFDETFLCSPRDNAVLNYLRATDGTYTLDLSSGTFYFVGLKGKTIFCKEIDLQTSNGSHAIDEVEKEVLERLMG